MEFKDYMKSLLPFLEDDRAQQFELYRKMLTEWNESKCNLTAITDEQGIAEKHFCDSILPEKLIPYGAECVDVGTGAGFPGIPLKIVRPDIKLVLIDSLKKRTDFLCELTKALCIDAEIHHARAEDAGRDKHLRERFDIALTRAVAQTNILLEWTSPFLKVGGSSLMYKSSSAKDELSECKNALAALKLTAHIEEFDAVWGKRTVICAQKTGKTPDAYPRKAGTAKKKPL